MNIFDQKLSGMKSGTLVRLVQLNGQTYEGVVTENDGSDSLSIQIVSTVTLRYSQIAGIELNSGVQTVPVISSTPVVQGETAKAVSAKSKIAVSFDEEIFKASFKVLNSEQKNTLNPVYNKVQSAIKSQDTSKLVEALDLCWKYIDSNVWEEDENVNKFYALCCVLAEEYNNAAESFMYANDMRNAYLSAFTGAEKESKISLYEFAAAYASMYIVDNNEFLDEASEVIMISSYKSRDVSGLKYVISKNISNQVKMIMPKILSYIRDKSGAIISDINNFEKCIAELTKSNTGEKIIEEIMKWSETEPAPVPAPAPVPVPDAPDPNKKYQGKITKYNFFEGKGIITENKSGNIYQYELSDISDTKLLSNIKAISTWDPSKPISVEFKASKRMGKDYAISITRVAEAAKSSNVKQDANSLYTQGRYEEAIKLYREQLNTPEWEKVFSQLLNCYSALWNKNEDIGYSKEMEAIIKKYSAKGLTLQKSYEAILQYYMKVQNYSEALSALNYLIESCDSNDFNRILNYLVNKSRCYRQLHDYQSAIGQLLDWLAIVKKNKLTDRYDIRKSMIYIELAELYYEIEDFENARSYANDSSDSERKQSLVKKLDKINDNEELDEFDEEEEDDDEDDDLISMSLKEAYDLYSDDKGLDALGINDADIVEKLKIFNKKTLYCLITWLTAASKISRKNPTEKVSALNPEFTVEHSVQDIECAFSYAYQNPLVECDYTSAQVVSVYDTSKNLIPQYNDSLLVSAALRTLFSPSNNQDYYLDTLIAAVEKSDISEKYPVLVSLLTEMKSFYESTGCAIDSFAGYRSNTNVIDNIVAEAKELCESIAQRNVVYESQGQVRRLREAIFSNEQSVLRKCLNIVAENNVSEFKFVMCMTKEFIRNNRAMTVDNVDMIKIDAYIDEYWDKARDMIINEGRHISRPHDKIKGSKRTNIIIGIKKIISCACDWLAVAEHSGNAEEAYIMKNYDAVSPHIIDMLNELHSESCNFESENGFDWGTHSIVFTTEELIAKMNGTYNARDKKYFFIGFLSGEDVLLNDDYLPELQSTLCGWNKMNILGRIEHHATEEHLPFEERLKQIVGREDTKHNFRTASLIISYANDTKNNALLEIKSNDEINACFKLAKQRFESVYSDFCDEMELFESYGIISNINGEKSSVLKLALDWYRITKITGDYGFYIRMLDAIKARISVNAAARGEELTRQLEDLADNPEYDFGIYTKEEIAELIEDQNYTSAESYLNCIRRHDTNEVRNYADEPYRYFSEFVSEQQTDYRAVVGAGKNIVDAIAEYSGKKDLELALIRLTNNARKETKGGAELLKNWPKRKPANSEDLLRLLNKLGFNPATIKQDGNNTDFDSYIVYSHKRSGKVTYVHPIPAFGSQTETDGFRVACLYGKFDCNGLMNSFRMMNSTPKNTLILLDFALNMEERRRLARKIKEEKSFSKTFIVIDRVILFYLAKHYAADTIAKRFMAVTLPFAYYQPFVEASTQTMPAELFTGREAELTSIESPEGANLVYGGRQLGKSALLKMAQKNVDKNGNNDRAVLIDVQYKNYQEVAKLLSQELITREILDESCECDNWDDLARHIKKRLMDENPETRINYLLIMLDEADEFIRTSAENDNPPISAVKNLPAGRFKLVMAGLHNLSRFNREMLHGDSTLIHLSSVVIKQFQRAEAIKLLTNTLAYLGFRFNKDVISNILNKTNYYPGLIQFYCQKLLEAMKSDDYAGYSELNTPYYEISESHFKKVLADSDFTAKVNEKLEASLFTEEKGRSHYHILALILAYLYYELPSEKKYTLDDIIKVAKEYKVTRLLKLDKEKIEELMNEMWDLNVVSREDIYFRFATEGFRELLGSKKQVEDEMDKYFEENVL